MRIVSNGKVLFSGRSEVGIPPAVGEIIWVNFKPYEVVEVKRSFNTSSYFSGETTTVEVKEVKDE